MQYTYIARFYRDFGDNLLDDNLMMEVYESVDGTLAEDYPVYPTGTNKKRTRKAARNEVRRNYGKSIKFLSR